MIHLGSEFSVLDDKENCIMQAECLQDLLEWTDGTEKYEKDLLKKTGAYNEIIIFGAGIGGRQTLEILKKHNEGEKVKAFCDNNECKIGNDYLELPVISAEKIEDKFCHALVLISSTAYDIIKEQLLKLGHKETDLYFFQPAGISLDGNCDMTFIKTNIKKYDAVYHQLNDEKSKQIYRCILNYRITKENRWLEEMRDVVDKEEDQYFDKKLLKDYSFEDGFVDAGAYVGDTAVSFFHHYPDWAGNYYCFEAEKNIYSDLNKNLLKNFGQDRKIVAYNYALWDKEEKQKLVLGDAGSRIGGVEGVEVNCCTLDKKLADRDITFIKMDIEGAEKKALLGAADIIKRSKPILAICIYHKREDFFEIPLLIDEMVTGEYTFYVRQYRYGSQRRFCMHCLGPEKS